MAEAVKMKAVRDAYGEVLVELGAEYPELVVLDGDLSGSTRTAEFGKKYPERFFNMGIQEQNIMGTAAGLALGGKLPFASTFAIFATGRAWEQVRQSIAYPKLNVKIVATHAGLTVGEDGASHQANEDIAVMRAIPNMTVLVPADAVETKAAIRAAAAMEGPVYIRLSREKFPVLFDEADYRFMIGNANQLRDGNDVAIVAVGIMVSMALEAAERLAREGIKARVINLASVKPLDVAAIVRAARQCGCIVTAEEHSIIGGVGSAVAETLSEICPVPIRRVGVRDTFGESGKAMAVMAEYGLTPDAIVAAAREAMAKKRELGR